MRLRHKPSMMSKWLALFVGLVAIVPTVAHASPQTCQQLGGAKLPNVEVLSAVEVVGTLPVRDQVPARTAGVKHVSPYMLDMPKFCRMTAKLTPVARSDIRIELWLPAVWNGKLLVLGNHGFAGNIERGDMAMGLQRGYAVAGTDTGHVADELPGKNEFNIGSAVFSQGDPVAVTDFAWRAVHEMTIAAKKLVLLRYGDEAHKSYFFGCSNGGREAIREVQDFPADYDGVIAGSAAQNWTRFSASNLFQFQMGRLPSGATLTVDRLAVARKAAVTACDALDGLADGVIADPASCHWNPHTAECKPGENPAQCLTPEEATAIARVEEPLTDPATGRKLYPGMMPGSELSWRNMASFNAVMANFYQYMVLNNPAWTADDALKADVFDVLRRSEAPGAAGLEINSVNPDLAKFREHGGRLIQYHGWNDPSMAPEDTERYYAQVIDMQPGTDKPAKTGKFYRLFMVPGMNHCYGGFGPINFGGLDHLPQATIDADHDVLAALDRWVEKGVAPDRIVATEFAEGGKPQRQMPICPYPKVAIYIGGDGNRAQSFACRVPGLKG